MEFDTLINTVLKEEEGSSPFGDILLNSSISLSRNLKDYPFPQSLSERERITVWDTISPVIKSYPAFAEGFSAEMDLLSPIMKEMLLEKEFITPVLATRREGCALMVSSDAKCRIMINEEDHLCIQVSHTDANMKKAWTLVDKWDDLIEKKLPYAFSSQWGYLTSSLEKIGTGLSISAILHLPGFTLSGYQEELAEAASKLDMKIERISTKNIEQDSYLFRLSTRNSLGMKEEELVAKMTRVTKAIIKQERNLLTSYVSQADLQQDIAEKVKHAFNVLSNTSSLQERDALPLLSLIHLGIKVGFISSSSPFPLFELFLDSQSCIVQKNITTTVLLPEDDRDFLRAGMIRQALTHYNLQLLSLSHPLDNNPSQQR